MTTHCRECLVEIPPTARTGCCDQCRPVRSHSRPNRTHWRHKADEDFRRLLDQQPDPLT
jgi:hypothetical protein